MNRETFLSGLPNLPAHCVLKDKEERRPYECDGLSAYRQLPWLVLIPETIEQVQDILRHSHKQQVPIIARGAGTGLSGGALPRDDSVLLSLARFNKIIEIDSDNRLARVQPGVRNLAISEAVADIGLYYAPDPSSQIACSIGGNVAENAGGVHCLKYGLTVHNIARIKIITIDGELLTIGSDALDSPGYDLLALMTGSEGLLGVIIEVTVRLLPIPEYAQLILAAFDSAETAGNAVAKIISDGILPAGLEMMDHLAIKAAEDFVHAGYPTDATAILLCELDGSREEVDAQTVRVDQLLQSVGATEVRIAQRPNGTEKILGRVAKPPSPPSVAYPPITIAWMARSPGSTSAKCWQRFINGRRNTNYLSPMCSTQAMEIYIPLILYDANQPGALEKTEEFGGRILQLCVSMGGTITGEHGVGIEKINQMCIQFNEQELQQFHAVKQAFDPDGLLNPGKAIPTLARCAEFGKMHVHAGELPFPDLERF